MATEKNKVVPAEPEERPDTELRARSVADRVVIDTVSEEAGDDGAGADPLAQIPRELSILPLRDNVLFPAVVAPLTVTRDASVRLIDDAAVAESRIIGIATLRDPTLETPAFADLYPVGVAAAIRMMVKMPDGVRLIVHGLKRIRLVEPVQEDPYIRCTVEILEDDTRLTPEEEVEV